MSFYDWYCDLPPASPQTWGEQTDVPESADWYNSGFLILWGSNVPQTRTPDAHFYTEARYRGTKSVVICPDYSEASKFGDIWLSREAGHRRGAGHGHGPRHPARNSTSTGRSPYFQDYARQYTDMPMLVRLVKQDGQLVPDRFAARLATSTSSLGETNNPEWKTVAYRRDHRRASSRRTARSASAGARRASGTSRRRTPTASDTKLRLSLADDQGRRSPTSPSPISATSRARALRRHRPCRAC